MYNVQIQSNAGADSTTIDPASSVENNVNVELVPEVDVEETRL